MTSDYNGEWKFRASNNKLFFIDDIGRGGNARVKNTAFPDGVDTIFLVKSNDPNDFVLFNTLMGNINAANVSTLAKPERERNTDGTRQSPQCKVWLWDEEGNSKDNWDQSKHKMRDGGVYVTLRRFKALQESGAEFDLSHQHRVFKTAGLIDSSTPIYGMQPRHAKDAADNPKWITLEEHAKANLHTVLDSSVLTIGIANAKVFADFDFTGQFNENESLLLDVDNWKDLNDSSLFKTFTTTYKYMSDQKTDGLGYITSAAEMLGVNIPEGKADYNLTRLWNTVLATYPMFEFLNANGDRYYGRNQVTWTSTMLEKVVQYIKGIDESL